MATNMETQKIIVADERIMRNIECKKYKEKTRKKRIPSEMTISMDENGQINVSISLNY